jgi:hypothetical protein
LQIIRRIVMTRAGWILASILVLALAFGAGCGDDDDDGCVTCCHCECCGGSADLEGEECLECDEACANVCSGPLFGCGTVDSAAPCD